MLQTFQLWLLFLIGGAKGNVTFGSIQWILNPGQHCTDGHLVTLRSWSPPDSLMFLLNSLQGLSNARPPSKPSESAHPPRPCVPEVIHNPGPLFSCLPASITPFILAQLLPCLQILPPRWVFSLVLALTHRPLTYTMRLLLKRSY